MPNILTFFTQIELLKFNANIKYQRCVIKHKISTNQSLVLEGVVNRAEQEPEWPQVLEAEVKDEVSHQYQHPHHQEFHIQKCAARIIEIKPVNLANKELDGEEIWKYGQLRPSSSIHYLK